MTADEPNTDRHAGMASGTPRADSTEGLLLTAVNAAPVTFGAICAGFAGGAVLAVSVGANPAAGFVGAAALGFPASLLEKHLLNRDDAGHTA